MKFSKSVFPCLIVAGLLATMWLDEKPLAESLEEQPSQQEVLLKLELIKNVFERYVRKKQEADGTGDEDGLAERISTDIAQAEQLIAKGELSQATLLLNEILKELNRAATGLAKGTQNATKYQAQYQELLTSIRSYRWPKDVQQNEKFQQISVSIKEMLNKAEALAAEGENYAAFELASKAHRLMVNAQAELRDAETVVYKLEFANKKEEYAYEKRRNDNYLLLLQLTLEKQQFVERPQQIVYQYLERSAKVRIEAEQEALKEDYVPAIIVMEHSNKLLETALRLSGVPLP